MIKKSSKFIKKITYIDDIYRWYDDTQPCKIFCPNSTSFVRYKNIKFLTNHLDNFLVWNLFFLLDKIFYKTVYHRIIWMCDFLVNLDNFFTMLYTDFHEVVVCTRYVLFFFLTHKLKLKQGASKNKDKNRFDAVSGLDKSLKQKRASSQ